MCLLQNIALLIKCSGCHTVWMFICQVLHKWWCSHPKLEIDSICFVGFIPEYVILWSPLYLCEWQLGHTNIAHTKCSQCVKSEVWLDTAHCNHNMCVLIITSLQARRLECLASGNRVLHGCCAQSLGYNVNAHLIKMDPALLSNIQTPDVRHAHFHSYIMGMLKA